jgi:hypothetical protein
MPRFILRRRGGDADASEVERVRAAPRVSVVDATPRMLLVEAEPADVHELMAELPGWILAEERSIPRPKPRSPRRGR